MASDLNRIEGDIEELRNNIITSVTIGGIVPYDSLISNTAYITGITSVHIRDNLWVTLRSFGDLGNSAHKCAFVSFHSQTNAPSISIGDSGGVTTSYSQLKSRSLLFYDFGTDWTYTKVSLADLGLTEPDTLVVCCGIASDASFQPFKGSIMATLFEERV